MSDLSKCVGDPEHEWFKTQVLEGRNAVCANSRRDPKMVPQNLGFRRVEATMCCGQYHFVATARHKKCPRSTIDFCLFHDMNLKIP